MKIVTVVGARPQFIKAAPVSEAFRVREMTEVLVHTGQHYDYNMSDVFFEELGMPKPAYNLGVGSGRHGSQTGHMLQGIEEVLIKERPDVLLVFGDTNSTLAGALAASKLHIPVAHVEAGLRSFNRRMPEEVNRVLTDHLSDYLFPPTEVAVQHLATEGISGSKVCMVGDVMFDAALRFAQRADNRLINDAGLDSGGYVLVTIHRAENTDDPQRLRAIFSALTAVADIAPVVLPLHPRTRHSLEVLLGKLPEHPGIHVVPPLGYLDMIAAERSAALIVTDSGGIQKEAFFFKVPCVTLRSETEWPELVSAGWNTLVDPGTEVDIAGRIRAQLTNGKPTGQGPMYGHGDAAERIAEILRTSATKQPY
jgi:UDP-GlcNAc3NAcA epimerase